MYPGGRVHLAQMKVTLSSKLHRKITSRGDITLLSTFDIVNVGKTSVTMKQEIREKETNASLVVAYMIYVKVDPSTRKSCALTDDFLKIWNSRLITRESLPHCNIISPPGTTFRCQTYVSISDTDNNLHTSHAVYFKYCLDCGRMAAVNGYFTQLKKDLALFPLVSMEGVFRMETLPGDLLRIECWEDKLSPNMIHSIIFRNREEIFYAKISFQLIETSHI